MIAIDTHLLIHAHRTDLPQHLAAVNALTRLAARPEGWAIPMPCAAEFLSVVTGSRFRASRTPVAVAFDTLDTWLAHPRCRLIAETSGHLRLFRELVERAGIAGPDVYDARIAAICLEHGVEELWTSDRDFARFPDLRVRDPLIPSLHDPAQAVWKVAGRQVAGRRTQAGAPVVAPAATPPAAVAPSKRNTPSSNASRPIVRRSRR